MKVNFYVSGNETHDAVMQAMYMGCPEPKFVRKVDDYEPSDIAVVFGIYKKAVPASHARGHIIYEQQKLGKDVIVLETGYINRGDMPDNHYAVGLNGMNGRADFRNSNSPPDRAKLLNVHLKPWRTAGEHILLCGQVPWDSSVEGTDHQQWLLKTFTQLIQHTDRPIIFRNHPLAPKLHIPFARVSMAETIEEELEGAWAHVSFNSNSGVDAVIAGVPSFAFDDYSMVTPLAKRELASIESPARPDREQWLNNIAYAQWTPDELAEGKAWQHLYANTACAA